jgi:hypothetical protein
MRAQPATAHFYARAEERWGFRPSEQEAHAMVAAIKVGEALRAWSDVGAVHYWVPVRGYSRRVVWSLSKGKMITALCGPAVPWDEVRERLMREGA